jgi:hypothetical protein
MSAKGFFQLGRIVNEPAMDGGMIHFQASLLRKLLNTTITQGMGKRPSDPHQYDILLKVLYSFAQIRVELNGIINYGSLG